ncbi:MAG: ABC transporter ATP-binding protein [Rhodospirillaceae bacterium]|nr:ABC transporter ATP-binding protein [Rhodospirillaceae bacterium]
MTVELRNANKIVGGETHLHDVSIALQPNDLNILLGPTTSGKTSILRLFAGLDRPTSGQLLIDGYDVTGVRVRRRDVAMVYQQFINYPAFTVYENIAAPLRRAGKAAADIDRQVRETAALLHIEHLLDRLPGELSGGQQQRTALARALVKHAGLLLLDEPLVNLDYKLREELRTELRHIFQRREATAVYATTEPHEALMLGGHVIVLDAGRALQAGSTIDVYKNPATIRVGQVFSDPPINVIDGRIEDSMVFLSDNIRVPLPEHFTALPAGPYQFGVRAHHLTVAPKVDGCISLSGKVELAEIAGAETFIHVRHRGLNLVSHVEGVHSFRLGEQIAVFVNPGQLFAFDPAGDLAASPNRMIGGNPAVIATAPDDEVMVPGEAVRAVPAPEPAPEPAAEAEPEAEPEAATAPEADTVAPEGAAPDVSLRKDAAPGGL